MGFLKPMSRSGVSGIHSLGQNRRGDAAEGATRPACAHGLQGMERSCFETRSSSPAAARLAKVRS